MVRITNQYLWNSVFFSFFILLVIMGVIILDTEAYIPYKDLGSIDFILIALASFRVMRLFAYDGVTKFIREQLYDAKVTKAGKVTLYVPAGGPRRAMLELIHCQWFFGLWNTALVVFFYLLSPIFYGVVLVLALASVVTLLQLGTSFFERFQNT